GARGRDLEGARQRDRGSGRAGRFPALGDELALGRRQRRRAVGHCRQSPRGDPRPLARGLRGRLAARRGGQAGRSGFRRLGTGAARVRGLRRRAVSESEEIVRVAARGDGVTASGRHVPLAAPGDVVLADGALQPGPHRVEPPCRHFGRCGGCQLQHLDEQSLAAFVRDRVLNAAEGQGLTPARVAPAHLSPPRTRRRATLRAVNGGGRPLIGFNEAGSHRVVDMRECHVLAPELFALVEPLRKLLAPRRERYQAELHLALADRGVDCAIKGLALEGLEQTEAMLDFCRDHGLARLTLDQGYGPEAFWEPEPLTVTLSGVPVDYPSGAFLQATADGEAVLVAAVREWFAGCSSVADLFAGLGTFAFALAGSARVTAAEAARDAHL